MVDRSTNSVQETYGQVLNREKGENAICSGQIVMVSGEFRFT